MDLRALARDLDDLIDGEVRFDDGSRALYSTDASNYRQIPLGVVLPRSVDDVIKTMAMCRDYEVPVLARGGGTSLAGQCCNVAVVMDMSKYFNRVLEVDAERKRARVQPGTVLDDLRDAAEEHDLTFGPDPATHNHCTLGGMLGNNSCGVHSVMAGKTVDNVEELDVLLYDGTRLRVGPTSEEELERIIATGGRVTDVYARLIRLRDRNIDTIRNRFPDIPRRVSGYNLDDLLPEKGFNVARALVGTEGTCVTILEATLRLVPSPQVRSLVVLGYPDVYAAADHVPRIMESGPIGLEGIDDQLIDYMKKKGLHVEDLDLLPDGGGWLLVEFGGESKEEADEYAQKMIDSISNGSDSPAARLYDDPEKEKMVWEVRESGLGATARVPGMKDTWPGWEDSAVAPEKLSDYLRDLRDLFRRYDYNASVYGHFGQGCVHCRIPFGLKTAEGVEKFESFVHDAADLCVRYGGSLSGEHGDGQARGPLLAKMYGDDMVAAFREFKAIWDPDDRMNPGVSADAESITANLRLGADYQPPELDTRFKYPNDDGNFVRATLRCVGVGTCRRRGDGTMCPSYMVTREEKHSTRGRARLLFELFRSGSTIEGWREDAVREALDLCLACKGCKSDCPVNVDMATYKAEFLYHYYKWRVRPRAAYAMGLIYWWARLASKAPRLANWVSHKPGFAHLARWSAGVAQDRELPRFANQTLRSWFNKRDASNEDGPEVILWPDTFNNFWHPETGRAAVEVLEAAGYRVRLPDRMLCCGRPLYDYGMLDLARRQLRQILGALGPAIDAGTPIVGLEPSCAATFRDELVEMFPDDEKAQRLSEQFYLLGEFLAQEAQRFDLPRLNRRAVVHGHCHQKAVMGLEADREILDRLGLDFEILTSGCCGMAGAFGFEKQNYEVSIKCGERVLLPAVREADEDTLIIADGFSCRTQIEQATDREALHLAQVIRLGLAEAERRGPAETAQSGVAAVGGGDVL